MWKVVPAGGKRTCRDPGLGDVLEAARNATWWELESVTGAEAANEVEMEQRALDADTHTHTHTHTERFGLSQRQWETPGDLRKPKGNLVTGQTI